MMTLCEWQVWEDWSCDDVLAVEAHAMTPALAMALANERIAVSTILAPDRASAVRIAFPHRFGDDGKRGQHPAPAVH